eukprot:g990.t1
MLFRRFAPLERLGGDADGDVGKKVDDDGAKRRFLEIEVTAHFPMLGGILADETGYGKTVTTLALIASDADAVEHVKEQEQDLHEEKLKTGLYSSSGNPSAFGSTSSGSSSSRCRSSTCPEITNSHSLGPVGGGATTGPAQAPEVHDGGDKGNAAGREQATKPNAEDTQLDCSTTTLIITPPHILQQWADEAERFCASACPKVLRISTFADFERVFSSKNTITRQRQAQETAGRVKNAKQARKRKKQEKEDDNELALDFDSTTGRIEHIDIEMTGVEHDGGNRCGGFDSVKKVADSTSQAFASTTTKQDEAANDAELHSKITSEETGINPFRGHNIVLVSSSVLLSARYLAAREKWEPQPTRTSSEGGDRDGAHKVSGSVSGESTTNSSSGSATATSCLLPVTVVKDHLPAEIDGSPTVQKMLAHRKKYGKNVKLSSKNKELKARVFPNSHHSRGRGDGEAGVARGARRDSAGAEEEADETVSAVAAPAKKRRLAVASELTSGIGNSGSVVAAQQFVKTSNSASAATCSSLSSSSKQRFGPSDANASTSIEFESTFATSSAVDGGPQLLTPLHAFRWRRIVFDEFHEALDEFERKSASQIEKNGFFLCDFINTAQTPVWALTGTPDVDSVYDVELMASIFGVDLLGVSRAGASALQELHCRRHELGAVETPRIPYGPYAEYESKLQWGVHETWGVTGPHGHLPTEELMPRCHDVENGTVDGWEEIVAEPGKKQTRNKSILRNKDDRFAEYHYRPAGQNYKYLKLSEAGAWRCHLCGERPTRLRQCEVRENPEKFVCENCGLDSHHWTCTSGKPNHQSQQAVITRNEYGEETRKNLRSLRFELVKTAPYFDQLRTMTEDKWDKRSCTIFTRVASLPVDDQLVCEAKKATKSKRDADVPNFTTPLLRGGGLVDNQLTVDEQRCYLYPQDNVARKREYFVKNVLFPSRGHDSLHPFDRSRLWRRNAQNFLASFARRNAAVGVDHIVLEERRVLVELEAAEKAFYLQEENRLGSEQKRQAPSLEDRETLLKLCSHFGKVHSRGAGRAINALLSPAEACARELRCQQRTVQLAVDAVCAIIRVLDYLATQGRLRHFFRGDEDKVVEDIAKNTVREQAFGSGDDSAQHKNRQSKCKGALFLPPDVLDILRSFSFASQSLSASSDEPDKEQDPVRSAITDVLAQKYADGRAGASLPFDDDSAMQAFLGSTLKRVQKMTDKQAAAGHPTVLPQNSVVILQRFARFAIYAAGRKRADAWYSSRDNAVSGQSYAQQFAHDIRTNHRAIVTHFSKCLVELRNTVAKLQFFQKVSKDCCAEKADAEDDEHSDDHCPVCLSEDLPPDQLVVLTSCGHRFCHECVQCLVPVGEASASGSTDKTTWSCRKKCPTCRTVFKDPDHVVPLPDAQKVAKSAEAGKLATTRFAKKTDSVRKLGDFSVFGTKIKTIAETIQAEKAKDAGAKFIVFVQFDSLLEILRKCFAAFGLNFVTLAGATPEQQAKFLTNFQKEAAAVRNSAAAPSSSTSSGTVTSSSLAVPASSEVAPDQHSTAEPPGGNASSLLLSTRGEIGENPDILLMSLNRNAAGANLTQASHVIFVHPMCGDLNTARAAEMQAIARARRFGQKRKKVVVYRFVARGTVEEELSAEHESAIAQQREADRKMREGGGHQGKATGAGSGGISVAGKQQSGLGTLKRRKIEAS